MSHHIDYRRLQVAQMLLRGLIPREIVATLTREKVLDPQTGAPYTLEVIAADVAFLQQQWEREAALPPHQHRARVQAELQAAKRSAWVQGDLGLVVRCLKQEAELFDLGSLPPSAPPLLDLDDDFI